MFNIFFLTAFKLNARSLFFLLQHLCLRCQAWPPLPLHLFSYYQPCLLIQSLSTKSNVTPKADSLRFFRYTIQSTPVADYFDNCLHSQFRTDATHEGVHTIQSVDVCSPIRSSLQLKPTPCCFWGVFFFRWSACLSGRILWKELLII